MDKSVKQLRATLSRLKRYVVVLCIVGFGAMYAYIIYTSGQLVSMEPSEADITAKYQGTPRPKIDETVANKLNDLQDQNIEVQTLFNEARDNPFAE